MQIRLIIFSLLVSMISRAQVISVNDLNLGYYSSYVYSDKGNTIPEGVNTWNDYNDYLNLRLGLSCKKIKLYLYFTHYNGRTFRSVREDPNLYGHLGSHIYTYNICLGKSIISKSRILSLEPFISLGLQVSKVNNYQAGYGLDFRGPLVYSTTEAYATKANSTQVIPSAGLRFYGIIRKTILFGIDAQFTYAFRPYQKISFDYYTRFDPTIKTAEFVSTGTGYFICPFLGFKLSKNKNSKTKKFEGINHNPT